MYNKVYKKDMIMINMINTAEILKYTTPAHSSPVIDADCGDIHIVTSGRIITARKRLQFKITHYVCNENEKEYQLDRELKFDANIIVKLELTNGTLRVIEAKSLDREPVIVGRERDCHENINVMIGHICLGTYAERLKKINLDNFGDNLCKALEYVFNVIQSALQKPNVCNSYQTCYSTKYDNGYDYDDYDDDDYVDDYEDDYEYDEDDE